MPFQSGSVSFRRFEVFGQVPKSIDQSTLDKLGEHAFRTADFGVPEDVEYGWSGGRHVMDAEFSFENNVYGDALFFGLRIDTNKPPSDVKKAYTAMEEAIVAKQNPSGFLTKQQKKEVKDTVKKKLDEEVKEGKYRKTKVVPVLWDIGRGAVYSPASGATMEKLREIFERTFGSELCPISSGTVARHVLEAGGRLSQYEDFRPTRFVLGPEGDSQHPEYPWVAKGPEPKDFLGNEFGMWLLWEVEKFGGEVSVGGSPVTVYFDKAIDLECAYGQRGKEAVRGEGLTKQQEVLVAIRAGKLPRRLGMLVHRDGSQYALTLSLETLAFGGLKLPDVENAESARQLFEERINMIADATGAIDALYKQFLVNRVTPDVWQNDTQRIGAWVHRESQKGGAA